MMEYYSNMFGTVLLQFSLISFISGEFVSRYEFENIASGTGLEKSPWRGAASAGASLHLNQGERILLKLCLADSLILNIDSLSYSNDGASDRIAVSVDRKLVGIVNTEETTGGWGRYWNVPKSTGKIGKGIHLQTGDHTLTLDVILADTYGTEIDALVVSTNVHIQSSDFWCGAWLTTIEPETEHSLKEGVTSSTKPTSKSGDSYSTQPLTAQTSKNNYLSTKAKVSSTVTTPASTLSIKSIPSTLRYTNTSQSTPDYSLKGANVSYLTTTTAHIPRSSSSFALSASSSTTTFPSIKGSILKEIMTTYLPKSPKLQTSKASSTSVPSSSGSTTTVLSTTDSALKETIAAYLPKSPKVLNSHFSTTFTSFASGSTTTGPSTTDSALKKTVTSYFTQSSKVQTIESAASIASSVSGSTTTGPFTGDFALKEIVTPKVLSSKSSTTLTPSKSGSTSALSSTADSALKDIRNTYPTQSPKVQTSTPSTSFPPSASGSSTTAPSSSGFILRETMTAYLPKSPKFQTLKSSTPFTSSISGSTTTGPSTEDSSLKNIVTTYLTQLPKVLSSTSSSTFTSSSSGFKTTVSTTTDTILKEIISTYPTSKLQASISSNTFTPSVSGSTTTVLSATDTILKDIFTTKRSPKTPISKLSTAFTLPESGSATAVPSSTNSVLEDTTTSFLTHSPKAQTSESSTTLASSSSDSVRTSTLTTNHFLTHDMSNYLKQSSNAPTLKHDSIKTDSVSANVAILATTGYNPPAQSTSTVLTAVSDQTESIPRDNLTIYSTQLLNAPNTTVNYTFTDVDLSDVTTREMTTSITSRLHSVSSVANASNVADTTLENNGIRYSTQIPFVPSLKADYSLANVVHSDMTNRAMTLKVTSPSHSISTKSKSDDLGTVVKENLTKYFTSSYNATNALAGSTSTAATHTTKSYRSFTLPTINSTNSIHVDNMISYSSQPLDALTSTAKLSSTKSVSFLDKIMQILALKTTTLPITYTLATTINPFVSTTSNTRSPASLSKNIVSTSPLSVTSVKPPGISTDVTSSSKYASVVSTLPSSSSAKTPISPSLTKSKSLFSTVVTPYERYTSTIYSTNQMVTSTTVPHSSSLSTVIGPASFTSLPLKTISSTTTMTPYIDSSTIGPTSIKALASFLSSTDITSSTPTSFVTSDISTKYLSPSTVSLVSPATIPALVTKITSSKLEPIETTAATTQVVTDPTTTIVTTPDWIFNFVKQNSFNTGCIDTTNVIVTFSPLSLRNVEIIARDKPSSKLALTNNGDDSIQPCNRTIWRIGKFDNNNLDFGQIKNTEHIAYDVNAHVGSLYPFPSLIYPNVTRTVTLRYKVSGQTNIARRLVYFTLGLNDVTNDIKIGLGFSNRVRKNRYATKYFTFNPKQHIAVWELPSWFNSQPGKKSLRLLLDDTSTTPVKVDFMRLDYTVTDVRYRQKVLAKLPRWNILGLDFKKPETHPTIKSMSLQIDNGKTLYNFGKVRLMRKPFRNVLTIKSDGSLYPYHESRWTTDRDDAHDTITFEDVSGIRLRPEGIHIVQLYINSRSNTVTMAYEDGVFVRMSFDYSRHRTKLKILYTNLSTNDIHFFSTKMTEYMASVNKLSVDGRSPFDVLDTNITGVKGQRFRFQKTSHNPMYEAAEEIELFFPRANIQSS